MAGFFGGLFGKRIAKKLEKTPAEAGVALAMVAVEDAEKFVSVLGKYGEVNKVEVYALSIFCANFAAKAATTGRLSDSAQRQLFDAFYRTLNDFQTRALKLPQTRNEEFLRWLDEKLKAYEPLARQIFLEKNPQSLSIFGLMLAKNVIEKNTLGKRDPLVRDPGVRDITGLAREVATLACRRIDEIGKVLVENVQFRV